MKLRFYQFLFRWTLRLCAITRYVDRGAQCLHRTAWRWCTDENLATCNERAASKEVVS